MSTGTIIYFLIGLGLAFLMGVRIGFSIKHRS